MEPTRDELLKRFARAQGDLMRAKRAVQAAMRELTIADARDSRYKDVFRVVRNARIPDDPGTGRYIHDVGEVYDDTEPYTFTYFMDQPGGLRDEGLRINANEARSILQTAIAGT